MNEKEKYLALIDLSQERVISIQSMKEYLLMKSVSIIPDKTLPPQIQLIPKLPSECHRILILLSVVKEVSYQGLMKYLGLKYTTAKYFVKMLLKCNAIEIDKESQPHKIFSLVGFYRVMSVPVIPEIKKLSEIDKQIKLRDIKRVIEEKEQEIKRKYEESTKPRKETRGRRKILDK